MAEEPTVVVLVDKQKEDDKEITTDKDNPVLVNTSSLIKRFFQLQRTPLHSISEFLDGKGFYETRGKYKAQYAFLLTDSFQPADSKLLLSDVLEDCETKVYPSKTTSLTEIETAMALQVCDLLRIPQIKEYTIGKTSGERISMARKGLVGRVGSTYGPQGYTHMIGLYVTSDQAQALDLEKRLHDFVLDFYPTKTCGAAIVYTPGRPSEKDPSEMGYIVYLALRIVFD